MEEIQAAPAEQEAGSEGEEDLDALYELLGKQGLNPSQQRKRKRKAQGGGTAPEDSAGFLNSYRARMQHVSNLVAAMRHHDSVGDDASLAHVLTTLMQATVRKREAGRLPSTASEHCQPTLLHGVTAGCFRPATHVAVQPQAGARHDG